MRFRLAWKLGAVVVAIITAAIAISGYVSNLIWAHSSEQSIRESLRFYSDSINKGMGQLMMSGSNERIKVLIDEMSRESEVYGDIRLISHHSGGVVASRFGEESTFEHGDAECAICHDREGLGGEPDIVDFVDEDSHGNRTLCVVAPIINDRRCAGCHEGDPPILGFLNVDYSLRQIDVTTARNRFLNLITGLTSLLMGIVATLLVFSRMLEKPISGLIEGTKRIAAGQLDLRFDRTRNDEVGVLEESFGTMAKRIRAHQEELRGAMEYLEGIVENSADIIITVTLDGFIETFNRGAEQALGYSRAEVVGRRIEMLFADPRERDVAIARLRDTDNVRNYETHFKTKEGRVRDVLLTLSRLRDREGNPIGTFGISKDVTEEQRLLRELVQSQRLAAIGQAVTGIQHAIKNSLNALKGGSYLVLNGVTRDNRERIQEGRDMIEEGIERIGNLSRNMLDYAKEWKLELERVDLNHVVSRACEENQQAAVDQGVALRHEPSDGLPDVLGDSNLIHMAVTDILVNAIDACVWKDYPSDELPEVVAGTFPAPQDGFVAIEVRDNGCGMDDDIRQEIFTPFFSTKLVQGTGLGLALTERFVRVHGGDISVESEPDRGSAFRIHLPIDGPEDRKETVDA